uniref:Odorant binding protein n=1 Tax=Heliothis virescens TaxID=7102 RepID=A0A2A4K8P0_HELVI
MSKFFGLVLCAVAATFISVASGQSLSESLKPVIEKCSKDHGVSEADIQAAKAKGSTDGINPCFIYCVFQSAGFFDSQGQYDASTGLKNLKQAVKDADQYKNLEHAFTDCSKIKDKPVTDAAGCGNGVNLGSCLLEHKTSILI